MQQWAGYCINFALVISHKKRIIGFCEIFSVQFVHLVLFSVYLCFSIKLSKHKQGSSNSKCVTEQFVLTNMAWAKAKKRGKSGYGEDINKKLNTLLHLLLLLHPRDFHQGKHEGVIFRTSMERKLRERHRESKRSLVSKSKI